MPRYLVEIKQEITTPVMVEAEDAHDAQNRAVCGLGEYGDQEAGELQIATVRLLEPLGAD